MICQNCLKNDARVYVTEVEIVDAATVTEPARAEEVGAFDESALASSLPFPPSPPSAGKAPGSSPGATTPPSDPATSGKAVDPARDPKPAAAKPPAPHMPAYKVTEQRLCKACADSMNLPHKAVEKKTVADIWKLLQHSAQQTRKKGGPVCPDCGLTLDEFRKKGRLGCPKDYEVFQAHIGDLLERVHGARTHVGRVPGASDIELERMRRIHELKSRLAVAIREEAYESAARLRDELKTLGEALPREGETGQSA